MAKAKQTPKRSGTALWISDTEGPLLRALAAAEDRPLSNVLARALRSYAAQSPEYLASIADDPKTARREKAAA